MRAIDADAFELDLMEMPEDELCEDCCYNVVNKLSDAPTLDAVPVVHGRWVFGVDSETGEQDLKAWTCSECNEKYPWQPNYCPNCGAKMDREVMSE